MADKYYDGDTDGLVTTKENWNGDAVPAANDTVRFDDNDYPSTVTAITGNIAAEISTVDIAANCMASFGASGTPLVWDIGGTGDSVVTDYGTGDKYLSFTDWVEWGIYGGGTQEIMGVTAAESTLRIKCSGTILAGGDTTTALEASIVHTDEATLTIGRNLLTHEGAGNYSTLYVYGGTVYIYSQLAALYVYGGTVYMYEGALANLYARGGETYIDSDGGVSAAIAAYDGATVTFENDSRSKTVAACTAYPGASVLDPNGCVTWGAAIETPLSTLEEVTLNLGRNRKYTVADI